MKKKIAYILVAILIAVAGIGLGVGAFNNLNSNEPNTEVQGEGNEDNLSDEDLMKKAVAYVKTIYKDVAKETSADYERIGTVPVGKAKFTVDWSVDVDENIIKIVKQENGMVTIDINEEIGDETPYVLTATISDGKGNSKSLTWEHVIPAKITGSYAEIVDMAYALKNGESLPNVATLQGTVTNINTPWDSGYKNITVTIVVEGREDKPIQCYRLKSGAADASQIEKGDLITVTGTLKNYNGTIEFDAGCTLDDNQKGAGKIDKVTGTMQEIVDKAYALGKGESLKGEATLTGWVKSIDTPYSADFKNITVTIVVEGRLDKQIVCYRLKGDEASKIKVGDIITVTGTLKNYNGTIEFDAGCTLDKLVKGDGKAPETPVMSGSMQEIVDKAYNLAPGASFTQDAVLTGKVTKVNTPWSSQYGNITVTIAVEGRENKPIKCYRLTGTNADKIAKGDTITVKGIITNYQGKDEDTGETWTEIEFKQGCQLVKWVQGVYVPPVIEEVDVPFKTGDKVVIWNPAYNKAFTTDVAATHYSAGANVNYANGVLRNYPDSAIFEVIKNSDKTFSFKQSGKTLGMADEYSSIGLGLVNDKWVITKTDDGKYHIMNMKREAYMEWYDAKDYWSGYGTISGKFFDLDVYVIPAEVPEATLADAVAKIESDYADPMNTDGEYTLVPTVTVDGKTFTVTWAIDTDDENVAKIENGKLVVYASDENNVEFTLTATVSDSTGSQKVEWTYTVDKVDRDPTPGLEVGNGYKFYLDQVTLGKRLYFAGTVNSSGFLETTEDIAAATEVYVEEVTDGVRFYFMDGETKTYIEIFKNSSNKVRHQLVTTPTMVYTYDKTAKTYVADIDGTDYYTGTYSNFNTFSASKTSYITGDNAANVGVSQFVAYFVDPTPGLEVGNGYKFYLDQVTLGKRLYFAGTVNASGFLETTEDIAAAKEVYVEETAEGVRFYFMDGETKTYIEIFKNSSNKVRHQLVTTPTMVYTYDETAKTYVADIGGTDYYTGTYSNFNTFSASKVSYITGDNAANVGVSQFVADFVDPTPGLVVGTAYNYYLNQVTLGKPLYFAGTVNASGFLETTEDIAAATKVYVEETTEGVRFYFMNGETKTYIEIFKNSSNKVRHQLVTTPTMVYTYDETAKTYVADIGGTDYYTGTYSNFNTFSASKVSYITGDNAANVGVSQFVAKFVEAENDTPAPTVNAATVLSDIATAMAEADYSNSGVYPLTTTVEISGVTYNVAWTSSNVSVASIVGTNLNVVASTEADAEFTLTAVVTNAADATDTATDVFGPYTVSKEEAGGNTPSGDAGYFVKVTEDSTDLSGTYLIVYEDGGLAFDGSLATLTGTNNGTTVTIDANDRIEATDALKAAIFTITKEGDVYTIKSASGQYIGNTGNSNSILGSTSTKYTNTITIDAEGNVNIVATDGGTYLRFNANDGQMRFRYYKSSTYTNQQPITLYKLVEE